MAACIDSRAPFGAPRVCVCQKSRAVLDSIGDLAQLTGGCSSVAVTLGGHN